MSTAADYTSTSLDSSVLNSFGNSLVSEEETTHEFIHDIIRSTTAIPPINQPDVKCCMWLLYLSFFLLSCVIMWFIITSLVVGFHFYRRSNTTPTWIQRFVKKRRNDCQPDSKIQIQYHQIIQCDVAKVPLLSNVGLGMDGLKGWCGTSMKDYILHRPPAPSCPKLEKSPKKGEERRILDNGHSDELRRYFSEKDVARENSESSECKVMDDVNDKSREIELEWRNNFNCKLTMNDLVQPTDTTLRRDSIDRNSFPESLTFP